MNTKFILPAALALTLHAFLLFGMPGKTLITAPAPEPPAPPEPGPTLDPDETLRVASDDDDLLPEPGGRVAPARSKRRLELRPPGLSSSRRFRQSRAIPRSRAYLSTGRSPGKTGAARVAG